ncbi:hypothetical protein EMCRGX_G010777 [Ephydatia muelleri]
MDYLSPGTFVALFVILALILALKRSKLSVLDVYLFFAILHGSSSSRTRGTKKPLRLHTYLARTTDLDLVSTEELYRFVVKFITAPSLDKETILKNFNKTLNSYSHVMLCRERTDGSLRGMMLIGIEHNGSYTVIKWGLVMFLNYYRGGPWMYWILIYVSLKELFLHPFTPLYHSGKIFSYKTYNMITPFEHFYPRVKQPTENYNQETCVLEREYSYIKEHVAPITDDELKNPHIKFFTEQNPGWRKGHCLIVITLMSWREVFKAAFIGSKRSKSHAASLKHRPMKPILRRGLTYQSPGFSSCAASVHGNGIANIDGNAYAFVLEDEEATTDQIQEPGVF